MARATERAIRKGLQYHDGLLHERWGKWALVVACIAAIPAMGLWGWRLPVAFLAGMWIGIYLITPDVDFLAVTRAESRWFRDPRRGDPLSYVKCVVYFHIGLVALALGFWPGLLLSHRGISHVPVLGAAVIALLAFGGPAGTLALLGYGRWLLRPEVGAAWGGFAVAHFVHILRDWLV